MKKFCLIIVALLLSFNIMLYFNNNFVIANETTSAKSMVVIEKESNRLIYSKNENEKLPMASTTKIVTALTVLENCDNLDEVVNVDDRAIGIPGTSIYLMKGEKLTVRELLYGMMLVSGNDAATALAYHISENLEDFCKLMKKTAESAGAYNSSFSNPHGLDEMGHFTTALDLALITSKALKNPVFAQIVSTKECTISGNDKTPIRYLKNKNRLLNSFNGATGVKTGFTDDAGRCFVGSAKKDETEFICVVLNCNLMFEECSTLLNKALNKYKLVELIPSYNYIKNIDVVDGREDSIKVYSRKSFSYPLSDEEQNMIIYEYELPDNVIAPIEKDDIVGRFNIYLNNELLFSENVYAMEEVESINILENIKEIIKNWNNNFLDIN